MLALRPDLIYVWNVSRATPPDRNALLQRSSTMSTSNALLCCPFDAALQRGALNEISLPVVNCGQ